MRPALLLTLIVTAVAVTLLGPGATVSVAEAASCAAPSAAKTAGAVRVAEDAIPVENDWDCDERANWEDNCSEVKNADQQNTDGDGRPGGDGFGDECDDDDDADGVPDTSDNCRVVANPGQEVERPGDTVGRVCRVDTDGDGLIDPMDNCSRVANPGQTDTDRDRYGDACDGDDDDDYRLDVTDNCPLAPNPDQADTDGDGLGNACDESGGIVTGPGDGGGTGGGGGGGGPADRKAPAIGVAVSKVQRRPDVAGGMPISVRCSEACAVTAEVSLSGRDARRLGLARTSAKRVVVARGDAALGARASTYVFFDLTRAAKRRLFRAPRVRATISLRVSDAASNVATARRAVTFRR